MLVFYALNSYLYISKSFNWFKKLNLFLMINTIICYSLIVLYNIFLIKYELRKSSFKVFNNIVGKHKYYYTKKKSICKDAIRIEPQ